jgi:phospholipase C
MLRFFTDALTAGDHHPADEVGLQQSENLHTVKLRYALYGGVILLIFTGVFSVLPSAKASGNTFIPIEHFIIIIQENHSFDNYFGTFPGANGIPAGTALPDYPGGPLVNKPFLIHETHVPHDLPHIWVATKLAYDNGAMDGFLWAEYGAGMRYYGQSIAVPTPNPALVSIRPRRSTKPSQARVSSDGEVVSPCGYADDEDPDAPDVEERNDALAAAKPSSSGPPNPAERPSWVRYTMSYMDYHVIPNYWEYARKFTLCDAFFAGITGPSVPNHLYPIAAQSGGLADNLKPGDNIGIYSFPSVIELLGNANITWKYYTGFKNPLVESIWNQLPGFQAYANDPNLDQHLATTSEFREDIRNKTLPQVCWLAPGRTSEHPPENVRLGMWYVTGLINEVMESSYWDSCAIIVMWDEYGGFYDHVPPVQTDEYGFGFRVPALIISPYSRNTVVHTQYDATSPLKLIETTFGLPSLTARDGSSSTMLECFDFTQTPLRPVIITRKTKLDFSDMPTRTP